MKVVIIKDIIRTITLSPEESSYLANLTQNYLGEGEESKSDYLLRQKVFNCTTRDIEGEADYK